MGRFQCLEIRVEKNYEILILTIPTEIREVGRGAHGARGRIEQVSAHRAVSIPQTSTQAYCQI